MALSERTVTGMSRSDTPADTRALGRRLGAAARPGDVLALVGPLGAGKTILAKGVAEGLGVTSVVNSPTFILMNEHHGRLPLYHIDAYRLEDPDDAVAAGLLDDAHADGVTVIEWADRLDGRLAADRLEIAIIPVGTDGREISWRATGRDHERLGTAFEELAGHPA